mmetsp:Transcript_20028/g.36146  ORF Transcript_20028/g.36146 Transcript_20028/m.36146 type:complete len:258 (-) Transcript_20028:36-809(-)
MPLAPLLQLSSALSARPRHEASRVSRSWRTLVTALSVLLLGNFWQQVTFCASRTHSSKADVGRDFLFQRLSASRRPRPTALHARLKRDEYKLNPFEVMGVKVGTSDKDIKKIYRTLARKEHPDVNKAPGAKEKWMKITWAYNMLMDQEELAAWQERQAESTWVAKERAYDEEEKTAPKTPWEAYMRREERKLAKQLSEEERDRIKRMKWWREKGAEFAKYQQEAKEREEKGQALYIPGFAILVPPVLMGIAFALQRI